MKIYYNKKLVELSKVCKNVDEFINLLDEKINIKKYINTNNPSIKKKLTNFFDFYLSQNGNINCRKNLKKDINLFFGFKLTGTHCNSIAGFIERGFSEEEAKNIAHNIHKEYSERAKNLREKLFEEKKEYEFGKIKYCSNSEPTCNLCGNSLILHLTGHGSKKILGCSNETCGGYYKNVLTKKKVQALVPGELYNDYIKRLTEKSPVNVIYWINKGLTASEAKEKITKIQKHHASFLTPEKCYKFNKQEAIKRLGEEKANTFYRERSRLCIEYWLKRGYTEKEGRNKISELQKNNSKLVKDHGVAKRVEYWVSKGYSEDEAKEKLSESQRTFSKEKCIEKYGEEEGLRHWKDRQDKWQKSLHESEKLHVGFSKVSQELFGAIDEKLGKNDYTFYGSKNHEYCIREDGVNYIYDFTDLEHNKIIEFQGDIYHGNPELFTENEHPNPYHKDKSCKDLWEFDKKKSDIAFVHGFNVLHVWEKDYRENKEKIINNCLNFILND